MENHDLAIIIPRAEKESLYRVLSSLTLQSDKRFAVYGFYLRGDAGAKALYEDYADSMDVIPCEVDAWPSAEASFGERMSFYFGRLGDECFVTLSDGETAYGRDCIRDFHADAWHRDDVDLFCWRTHRRGRRSCSFRRFFLDEVLGTPWQLPAGAWVLRRIPLEQRIAAGDYFSATQVLLELAQTGGIVRMESLVSGEAPMALPAAAERCSLIEWAEERFPGAAWPLCRKRSLYLAADLFSDMAPSRPLKEIRERFLQLKMAQGREAFARFCFFLSTRGL